MMKEAKHFYECQLKEQRSPLTIKNTILTQIVTQRYVLTYYYFLPIIIIEDTYVVQH